MRIFPPAIEIGDLEGFSSEKDIFKRAEFGAGLANILKVSEDPLVVVLDGPWGSALSELVMSLPESPDSPSKENPPQLIFIIDELDRCKPTFALEIIEKIKHIFSVPGIHFLIVTHLKQLENSVRYSYGADIDSQTDLQKF